MKIEKHSIEQLNDKRKTPRENCFTEVTYSADGKAFTDFIMNYNSNGIFIETRQELSEGKRLTMVFALPESNEFIKIYGKIIRTEIGGIGVVFNTTIQELLAAA